jgi:glycine/D-amino acid oxidase-like deaminating enzyme
VTSSNADIVVVGTGAVGTSIAFELRRRGHRVTLVGERTRPFAASVVAGAMLGCFGEVTTSTLASPSGRAKLATDYRARTEWPRWDDELSAASGIDESVFAAEGTVVVLNSMGTATVDSANFNAIEATLRQYDEPFESVDPEELDWFSPDELARAMRAIHIPAEHAVDASLVLAKLARAFVAAGGSEVDASAREVEVRGGRVTGIRLANGDLLSCDQVVVAAGAQSLTLLGEIGEIRNRIPPMVSGYGISLLLNVPDGKTPDLVLRTPNRAFACGIHCLPRGNDVLYVGGTNIITEQPQQFPRIRDMRFLLNSAVDQLHTNLQEASILATQVGNRPVTADGFPLIGSAGVDGLWLATGTYRDGLHQSPLLAQHMAAMIESGRCLVEELSPFTPVRSPLPTGSRREVVDSAVDQMMASGYEMRWSVIPEWPERIEGMLRREYVEAVESLHQDFTPPPEFIPKLTESMRKKLIDYYASWS